METGSAQLDDVKKTLAGKTVYARMTLEPQDASWYLRASEIVVGKEPPRWRAETWDYRAVRFVAASLDGDALVRALDAMTAQTLAVAGTQVVVPATGEYVNMRRQPSWVAHDDLELRWPRTEFELSGSPPPGSATQAPSGYLVGGDGPPFASYE